jgi:hypothetical protein
MPPSGARSAGAGRRPVAAARSALAALALALVPPGAAARAGDVGIDAVHGWDDPFVLASGSAFDGFRRALVDAGHRLVPLDSFGAARISPLDALVLLQPYEQNESPYSDEEVEAITSFVARGGGLLALAEAGSGVTPPALADWNRLLLPYGVAFSPETSEPSGRTISALASHSLLDGVATIGIDYHRRLVELSAPARDLTLGSPRDDTLAVVDAAGLAGRVVVCGDTSLFMDDDAGSDRPLSFADNARFLLNAIAFVAEPIHERAMAGNVNAAVGPPVDVLFVNDSAGGPKRRVEAATWQPIDVHVTTPPSAAGRVPFVLWAWSEEPRRDTVTLLPFGLGLSSRPMPFAGADPAIRATWNAWGRARAFGSPRDGTPQAPATVFSDRNGAGRPARVFLQGLVLDAWSPSGAAAVTNGVILIVR